MVGSVLVERDGELDALRAATRHSLTGGAVVLVEGPAGIGKSRLLDEVREGSEAFEVLAAGGGALETDIAFGLVRQLFGTRVTGLPPVERSALLDGPARPAARVLGLSELGGRPPVDLASSLHGLFWLVTNLAERGPLLLVADDIQWADRASVEFLVFLARRIEGLPIFLVAAARSDEPSALEDAIGELGRHATVLRPEPLSARGVGELVRRAVGDDAPSAIVEACHAATGGNPFYVGALLADLTAPGTDPSAISADAVLATAPSTARRSILLRLNRLPDPAPRLAVAAALLGDGAALRHAAQLAAVAPDDAERAADMLVSASILSAVHPLRFAHPIVRVAIAAGLPPAQRAAAHRRAALLLKDQGEAPERIVAHLLHAAPAGDEWTVGALHRAAREAYATGAPEIAVRLLRRALAEPPPSDPAQLLGELSAAEFAVGAYAESAQSARRAVEAAADPVTRAEIRHVQAYALIAVEGAPAALRCLEQGIEEAGDADPQLALLLEGELALQASLSDVAHPALGGLRRHSGLAGETYAERFVLGILALDAFRREDAATARELALRALAGGRLLAEGTARTMAYYTSICALLATEALDEAREAIAAGATEVIESGLQYGYPGVAWTRGMLALAEGRLAAAEADMRACVQHAMPTFHGGAVASLALVLLEQGDIDGAYRELEQAGLLSDERPLYLWGPYVRGLVRLGRGEAAAALADLQDVGRHADEVGGFAAGLPWGAHVALAHHGLGDNEAAVRAAAEALERAQRLGTPRRIGIALHACGLVGPRAHQIEQLTAAVDVLEASPAVLELAKARCDLGVALLRDGRHRAGRRMLELAHDGARACGARSLAQRTHEQLRIAGARPRRLTFSGVEALTASERRVAEMAADGLTNREIAQALFVTPKTVGNQLGSAYAKLGVSSRRALPDVLRRTPARR